MGNTVGGLKSGMKTFQSCDKKEKKTIIFASRWHFNCEKK